MQFRETLLKGIDGSLFFRRHPATLLDRVTLALLQFGSDTSQFFQERLFLFIVLRADRARTLEGHVLI